MNKKTTRLIFSFLLIMGWGFMSKTQAQQAGDSRILMQGFYWDCYQVNEGEWYNIISNNAQDMANAGIDMIWLPQPASASGGMGYLPTELYNLNNSFGTETEHRNLLSRLNQVGIEPIADIVINHRNGSTNWADFKNPEWDGTRSITSNDEVWSQPGYGHLPRGGNDTGENYEAARDLDHTNGIVRQGIKDWLQYLKDAGYKGWRYDLVKGFAPSYIAEYNGASNPTFSVGEFYDFDKQKVQNWVDGTSKKSTAFDFPTYATIKDAIKDNNYSYLRYEGQASGLIGWSPAQSTTFIENHDTPRYDSGRNILNSGNVCIGYAYLLTHPGTPTIYWPHYFDWGVKDKINELISVRKGFGITNTSSLDIVRADQNCYAAIVNGNVAVKLGSASWSPGSEYTLQTSGNNYAVWAKGTNKTKVEVTPSGGNFSSGSVTVQMSATNNGTIYYTKDGSTPNQNSIRYTGSFTLNSETTIKAIAYSNQDQSDVIIERYTFNEQSTLTIMWKTNVSNPRLWFWNIIEEGNNETFSWPGAPMQVSSGNPGWVEYTIEGAGGNFIFSDGGNNQTEDLVDVTDQDSNPTDGIIWYDNGWVDGNGNIVVDNPVITPNSGSYQNAIQVEMSAGNGSNIYYTLDGSTPNSSSSLYTSAINITSTTTVKAIAINNGVSSDVVSKTYTIGDQSTLTIMWKTNVSNPRLWFWNIINEGNNETFSWPGAPMQASSGNPGWVEYTIEGSGGNFIFSDGGNNQTEDLVDVTDQDSNPTDGIIWYDNGWVDGNGNIVVDNPVITPNSGSYQNAVQVEMSAGNGSNIYYTLDGSTPNSSSSLYTSAINITSTKTVKAIAINNGVSSDVVSKTYTIGDQSTLTIMWKTNVSNPRLWFWNIIDEGNNETFTWPGATMQASSGNPGWVEYTIEGSGGNFIFSDGGNNQTEDLENVTDQDSNPNDGIIWYDNDWVDGNGSVVVNMPVINPNGGTFDNEVTIELTAENGASIYYTLDGSAPSASSTNYNGTFTITASTTVKAIAIIDGVSSNPSSASFVKNGNIDPNTDYFTWDNANVYFVMTDRFYNGDTSNDNSYGRGLDGNGNEYPDDSNSGAGEFHGGDLKGMTAKLREGYFEEIGVNAIWITSPVEQMHGWCGGGPAGNFRHYGYHGYYALDWSELDKNMGTEADLMEFVDEAHSRGIRIVMDVVINHTGYATMHEMEEFNYGTVDATWRSWMPQNGQTWHSYHDLFVNYSSGDWTSNYWGPNWIRHPDISGYETGGGELTMCVGFLPDLKTESTQEVGIPGILRAKWTAEGTLNQKIAELDAFFNETQLQRTVSNYMIFWLIDWVRKFGIDGFRIDTAKHVDKDVLKRLKEMAVQALKDWKAANPNKVMNDDEFWTTGEVWGHGFDKSEYHTQAGFNSIINFGLQSNSLNRSNLEGTFADYARVNNDRTWNGLSYLSSHDTHLYDRSRLREVAPGFLLLPGGIQTYYGDETARPLGTYDDEEQNTRSDMNWGSFDQATFNVWKKLGTFRRDHPSIGAGTHTKLSDSPYTFARDYVDPVTGFEDNVIIAINANGTATFDVSDRFPDGHTIEDYYTGARQTVENGRVTFTADSEGIILLWDTDFVNVNKPVVNFVTTTTWSEDPLEIVLSISDKEDDNPTLYYTFDASLSTDNLDAWNVYTNPFTISNTQTIRIVGVNDQGNMSRVNSRKYTIGAIEPMTLWLYKPSDWADAYVFYDVLTPEDAPVSDVIAWPGAKMKDEGNNWYSYSITALSAEVIVFNGGSNTQQTADLSRTGDGWYRDGTWYDSCPGDCPGPKVPTVTITIGGENSSGNYNVSISATENGVIYYTTDNSTPSQSSTSYNGSFEVAEGTTVKAIAYNDVGESQVVSKTAQQVETLTFMWKTTASNNPSIHIWNVNGVAGDLTSWPGATMTASSEYTGWFEYTIEGHSANVIFNGNSGQTDDLINISDNSDGEADGIVWYNNGWTTKPTGDEDELVIHYYGNYTNIYYWGDGIPSMSWPGVPMDSEGNGWLIHRIDGVTCANVIFNGNGSQTADLYRCGEGWYRDGNWYDSNPGSLRSVASDNQVETSNSTGDYLIYPNPADDHFYISNVTSEVQVVIYNSTGMVVYSEKTNGNEINVSHLAPGLYFVKVENKLSKIYIK